MPNKIFGTDYTNSNAPQAGWTISINNGTELNDVELQYLYKAFGAAATQALLDLLSTTQGVVLYYNGTDWVALAPGTAGYVLKTGGAGANPSWGLAEDLSISSQAQGDVLYFNGTNWVRLAAGTSGKYLKTQGTGANPIWDTPGDSVRTKYIITPSVASNNLSVAIKYMDGNDPSSTNVLVFRVGGTEYFLAAAASYTKNAATNWHNAGGAELATQDVDYFMYAIGETGASAGLKFGHSRIPWATTMSDFVNTSTNAKYIAGNWTNFNATDPVVVIGRFRARLSAGAGYTWSIPTAKVINRPTWETDVLTFTPTISGFAATPSAIFARYVVRQNIMTVKLAITGTSNNTITSATLPFVAKHIANYWQYGPTGYYQDNSTSGGPGITEVQENTNLMSFYKSGYGAWTNTGTKSAYTTSNIEIE